MKRWPYTWFMLAVVVLSSWAAESRNEIPDGPLGFVAYLVFLVLLVATSALDTLRRLEKRLGDEGKQNQRGL